MKYKCFVCYNCPCCQNSLNVRASSLQSAQKAAAAAAALLANQGVTSLTQSTTSTTSADSTASQTQSTSSTTAGNSAAPDAQTAQSQQAQKAYYLICGYCRWTSRDVGLLDCSSTPVTFKMPENPHSERIAELLKGYKAIASREKHEKDRKKYPLSKRRPFQILSSSSQGQSISGLYPDKYGILAPALKRLSNITNLSQQYVSIEEQFKSLVSEPKTVDSFEPLPEDFFTRPFNSSSSKFLRAIKVSFFEKNIFFNSFQVTTIKQRHANPEHQPIRTCNLFPLNKSFISKESKRCNGCEHNVLKPESNITSIKFKLHQMAL